MSFNDCGGELNTDIYGCSSPVTERKDMDDSSLDMVNKKDIANQSVSSSTKANRNK